MRVTNQRLTSESIKIIVSATTMSIDIVGIVKIVEIFDIVNIGIIGNTVFKIPKYFEI